ncbi:MULTISPECIES: mycothiol transferase [unclassified Streptomyces]|uniref:mycothiol transferase n=1 Tax=unclassified Streptomyces TaxID=2593676 RepID=UPI002E16508D|nr:MULTISPECIES: DinB family protein [unclassified Streptomyces]WSR22756.1 DinB family protein [Streptomyces sp. NBC_01205]
MKATDVLADAYGRIREVVHDVVEGLSAEELNARLDPGANSIAWLVWHLTRVQDDHVADASGLEQVWTAQGWFTRFSLPLPAEATGYGHTAQQVGRVRVASDELLLGYFDAVHERSTEFVRGLAAADLDRVVDAGWDPPVTLGVRLVSILSDDLQHAGQAAYVRGALRRR